MAGRRWLGLVSAVLAVAAVAVPASAAGQERAGRWETTADQAYAQAEKAYDTLAAQGKNVWAFHVASFAYYAGMRFGWQDPRTQTWLQRVYQRRTQSLGYGIGVAYDAYGDGTVNPANTTYTITTSFHVGQVLIAGYDGGGVPAARVTEAVKAVLDTAQTAGGKCVAYSKHVNDSRKPCVWNVSAFGAWFLWRAHQRGLYPAGRGDETLAKVRTWRDYVRAHYSTSLGGWNYQEGGPNVIDDPGHLSATVAAMYELDPSIGVPALAAYWKHYPVSVSGSPLVNYECSRADAHFSSVAQAATGDEGSPEKNVTHAVLAAAMERIAKTCDV
jgi:hypothetical protein